MRKESVRATRYSEYLRKSTDDKEKQVLSLGSQRDVLDRLKKAHSLHIVETIEEKMSAKRPGRPGFNQLIKHIKNGKVDGIVTWAPHRLSRNSVDIGEIINLFDTGHLKEIVTDSHTYRNNPMDIFMLGFHCLQAKFENDNKALDVKGGMERCAKLGIYPGCPPLGYLPDKGGIKGARKRDIDPINFPLIRRMWDLLLTEAYTPYQILNKAIEEWGLRTRSGKKPSKSTTYKIFHNPFYYGEFEYPKKSGLWHKGVHKPMITKSEFDQVQRMMKRTDNARPIKNYYAFGGCALHCGECGCAITGMAKTKRQKNGNIHHYLYYGCTKRRGACSQMPITEKALLDNVENILNEIQIPESVHEFIVAWIQRESEKQPDNLDVQTNANKKAYEQIQRKIDGLIDMRISNLITDIEFQERRIEMDKEKNRLAQLIQDGTGNIVSWVDTAQEIFKFAESAAKSFKNGSPEHQRAILLTLGRNLSIKSKQLDLTTSDWIIPVSKIAKRLREELPPLEPILSPYYQQKVSDLLDSPLMCSLLHDVKNLLLKKTGQY
jgi:DNA invertase Pin-like site-specific DNA recombinase